MSKGGLRRLDWIRSVLNRLYNSALEERKDTWEPAPQKLIYCESGRIGPYFLDFSANRTTMHLQSRKSGLDSPLSRYDHFYRADSWEKDEKSVTLYDRLRSLTQQRRNDPDGLGAIAVKAERGMLFRLERAFQACFRRCKAGEDPGYPRFRPISRMETIDIVDPRTTMVKKRARGYAIRPQGFPTIRLFPARPLPDAELKALRIVRKPNRVYVDLTYEVEKQPMPGCASAVGIDLGVRKRAVLSTGERIERNTRDWAEIRRQQRKIARCRRGSNRRKKRVRRLAGMRFREGVRNRNACHRQTTEIIRKNGLIAVEKLDIKGMTTKGLKRKGLNREMLSQQWGLLRNQLQYKAEWAGREFVEVNPQYIAGLSPLWCPESTGKERDVSLLSL